MVCLDIDHPEIEDFIQWKSKEERKASVLASAGYGSSFNDESYATISGQNSNNSIRLSDHFIDTYNNDGEWVTRSRTTGKIFKKYEARDLMNKIAHAAWECADPGVQFDSEINKWHTCPESGRINASNPCSEYMFLDDSACNLASLNLVKFLRDDGKFDIPRYRYACKIFFIAQEILVSLSSYPTAKIAETSYKYRPLGLGYANLGSLLMLMHAPYDSDKGRAIAAALTAILTGEAYTTSAKLASITGAFEGYKKNSVAMLNVIDKHTSAINHILPKHCPAYLLNSAEDIWYSAKDFGKRYGYRNAQATVLAPTGTIGLVMDCDTTGVEPDYALVKLKKLSGGGYLKIANDTIYKVLDSLGYDTNQISEIKDYVHTNLTLEDAPHIQDRHLPIFDCANKCGPQGKRYIKPSAHLDMLEAVQPFLSGSVSKTINLPTETTVEEIEKLYIDAWQKGIKSISLYRDGCKLSQPLNADKDISTSKDETTAPDPIPHDPNSRNAAIREPLPNERPSLIHKFEISNHKGYIIVGFYEDGRPGEVFLKMSKQGSVISGLLDTVATMLSLSLQYGIPLESLVKKFSYVRFEPEGLTNNKEIPIAKSIIDYIFRWLELKFLSPNKTEVTILHNDDLFDPGMLDDQSESISEDLPILPDTQDLHAPICTECGGLMIVSGSCHSCPNCGATSGCG